MNSKKIFWALAILMGTITLGVTILITAGLVIEDNYYLWEILMLSIFVILGLVIVTSIGRFVYKDATRRGMDPWLWMTIAIFVPNLIGLIIYFVFRSQYSIDNKRCEKCQRSIKREFNLCPYCGNDLLKKCKNCGTFVDDDWLVCPKCTKSLEYGGK